MVGKRAQGTIEYLVIIAVVVILSLVVVGLVIGTANPLESSPGKLTGLSSLNGLIHVDAFYLSPDGNYYVIVEGLNPDQITIDSITIDGVVVDFKEATEGKKIYFSDVKKLSFSSISITAGTKLAFRVPVDSASGCVPGTQKLVTLKITYTTSKGLTKVVEVKNYPIACQSGTVSSAVTLTQPTSVESDEEDTYVPPSSTLSLSGPADSNEYYGLTPVFTYALGTPSDVSACSLKIDGVVAATQTSSFGSISPSSALTAGAHTWDVNCTLTDANLVASSNGTRTIYAYNVVNLSICKQASWTAYTKYDWTGGDLNSTYTYGSGSGNAENLAANQFLNCFVFNGDSNIIVDCHDATIDGNNIYVAHSGLGIGALIQGSSKNIKIMNCGFERFAYAIKLTGTTQDTNVSSTSSATAGAYSSTTGTGNILAGDNFYKGFTCSSSSFTNGGNNSACTNNSGSCGFTATTSC